MTSTKGVMAHRVHRTEIHAWVLTE